MGSFKFGRSTFFKDDHVEICVRFGEEPDKKHWVRFRVVDGVKEDVLTVTIDDDSYRTDPLLCSIVGHNVSMRFAPDLFRLVGSEDTLT
jgi:hypothetical protein